MNRMDIMAGSTSRLFAAAAFAVVLLGGCGGGAPGANPTNPNAPTAARLDIALDKNSVTNSGTDTVGVTITAVSAQGVAVANVPISVAVDSNGIYQSAATATDSSGKLTGTVGTGSDKANRVITIKATSGNIAAQGAVRVTGAQLTASGVSAVTAGTKTQITFQLVDINAAAIVGQSVSIEAPGFSPSTATGATDASGRYVFEANAPSTAGQVSVTGKAAGANADFKLDVGSGTIPVQPAPIRSASIQVNPATIRPNLPGATDSRAEVRVLVLGDNNVPLPHVRVRFSLPDPNSVGGSMSSGSGFVYTDGNGIAQAQYVAGTRTSPTGGVVVRACYDGSDFAGDVCPAKVDGTLTVSQQALSVVVGFDNQITNGQNGLTYIKQYVVVVSDAAGNAVPNATLSASLDPARFHLGYWEVIGDKWAQHVTTANCKNEDVNRNGSLDVGEDKNGNGILDPRIPLALTLLDAGTGTGKTNNSGMGLLQIEYPENFGSWVDVDLAVSAVVAGSEGRYVEHINPLWVMASDANNKDATPAFVVSPFGRGPTQTEVDPSPAGGWFCK